MAYTAHRTDITVPIMTPTEPSHPSLPSPDPELDEETSLPYDAHLENHATSQIISATSPAPASLVSLTPTNLNHQALKLEAQSAIDINKFTTKKAFKAYLDDRMEEVMTEIEERARKRSEALRGNERVEEEVRKLEGRYETERRALGKRMIERG